MLGRSRWEKDSPASLTVPRLERRACAGPCTETKKNRALLPRPRISRVGCLGPERYRLHYLARTVTQTTVRRRYVSRATDGAHDAASCAEGHSAVGAGSRGARGSRPRRTGAGAGSADRDVERPPLPASRLRRTPVVPLLGPLLACWSFSDMCSGSAPTPGPHCDNGKAHDDEKDPDQKQDIADLVDVESRSMHCDSEPQDGSNDHQHEPERRHTDA
jgi:hypothetical protein